MRNHPIIVLAVTASLALSACVDTDPLIEDLAGQQSSIAAQQERIDELTETVRTQESSIAELQRGNQELVQYLSSLIAELPAALDEIRRDVEDAIASAQYAQDRADDVAACLNEYMDVIGRWSANVYSYYEWNYC